MIYLFHTKFEKPLPAHCFHRYLRLLPVDFYRRWCKYSRWKDQYARIFGRLLLLRGLLEVGIGVDKFKQIHFSKYGRPFIHEDVDFSISHSGNYVLCAIGLKVKLGVDIEILRAINLSDVRPSMSDSEWNSILGSVDPVKTFLKFWTIKESIVKAEGTGLSIPLQSIQVHHSYGRCYDKLWFLNQFSLDENAVICLATDQPKVKLGIVEIDFASREVMDYYQNLFWEDRGKVREC